MLTLSESLEFFLFKTLGTNIFPIFGAKLWLSEDVRSWEKGGKTRIYTQKETNRKKSIAKMTEVTFNF